MTKTTVSGRVAALSIAIALLAGCKITDDSSDGGFSGRNNQQNNGGQGAGSQDTGSPPTIWGDPPTSVVAGTNYAFQPDAEDADGDVLRFSIANKPRWASFSASTGLLLGIPNTGHVGEYTNIVISVSDENSIVSLPSFDITVADVAPPAVDNGGTGSDGGGDDGAGNDDDPVASAPPTIAGKPNTAVVVGNSYSFQPQASDPEGDTLSFSIVNKPSWASFSTTTGRLSGKPDASHLGLSAPIEISVTDGTSVAALSPFRIAVEAVGTVSYTLSWNAPTLNVDGSPLMDLAGYRIYYGTAPGEYSRTIELNSPGITSYTLDDLAPGTYYLAMSSVNSSNLESARTPEINFNPGP